jgi:RNA polymerase sigma-70 factor (ECF subfamily)
MPSFYKRAAMIDAGQVILSESVSTTDASGDELEATVREQGRLVYKIAYSVLRNHHDAEDVAQETFLRFLRHRKRWAEIRDRRAWLATVAWRVALDRKRMPAEVALEEAAEVVSKLRAAGAPVDEIAASRQMMSLLERLVSSLPRDLREALILSATQELTSAEISQVLGIPEGSVRTRLLRAREILREKLAALLEHKHAR